MGSWASSALVVANERAGTASTELIDSVVRQCAQVIDDVTLSRTAYRGHATELAAKAAGDRIDTVVVVGGDGTTSEAVNGLLKVPAEMQPVLINIPAGTGNSFYREIWRDRPWQQALDIAFGSAEPRVRRLDMMRVAETGDLVILGACSGLVAEALTVAAGITDTAGRERYQRAVALTLQNFTPHPGRVTVDGDVVHDGSVVFANVGGGRYRGGQFKVLPHSVLDDGLLDVCVVGGQLDLRELPGLTRDGSHLAHPAVTYRRGRRIVIERTDGKPLTFEWDGEARDSTRTSYTLEILPGVLSVLAPPEPA
ncbi:diacylglycerol kinase family protein [Streptomyces sp. NPDC051219]|uniref:diacylglycerol/lipid kinase family protein n=1 Tax=Streptomyces sp. NPDC051219 TaxID=3155283 RepID=UPI00342C02A8